MSLLCTSHFLPTMPLPISSTPTKSYTNILFSMTLTLLTDTTTLYTIFPCTTKNRLSCTTCTVYVIGQMNIIYSSTAMMQMIGEISLSLSLRMLSVQQYRNTCIYIKYWSRVEHICMQWNSLYYHLRLLQ